MRVGETVWDGSASVCWAMCDGSVKCWGSLPTRALWRLRWWWDLSGGAGWGGIVLVLVCGCRELFEEGWRMGGGVGGWRLEVW